MKHLSTQRMYLLDQVPGILKECARDAPAAMDAFLMRMDYTIADQSRLVNNTSRDTSTEDVVRALWRWADVERRSATAMYQSTEDSVYTTIAYVASAAKDAFTQTATAKDDQDAKKKLQGILKHMKQKINYSQGAEV